MRVASRPRGRVHVRRMCVGVGGSYLYTVSMYAVHFLPLPARGWVFACGQLSVSARAPQRTSTR